MIDPSIPETGCCPKFDPTPWDEQELHWEHKRFLHDRVRSFFHMPLNMGAKMRQNMARIEAAGAKPANPLVLMTNESLWGSDLLIEVTGDVPGAALRDLSGTFLAKVFEGPYQNMGKWMQEMQAYVTDRGKTIQHLYTYYTTCPKCAKTYKKNYVVLLAQIA